MRWLAILLAFLSVVIGAGPAAATDVTYGDGACAEFADFWINQARQSWGVGLTPENVAALTPCAQDTRGVWFQPAGPNDPRLPGGVLTAAELTRAAGAKRLLEGQRGDFMQALAANADPWGRSPSLRDTVEAHKLVGYWYIPEAHAVTDQTDGRLDYETQQAYWGVTLQFLQDPNHGAFASYVHWWGSRRQAALPCALQTRINPMAMVGIRKWLRLDDPPLPWELSDAYTEALFLKWALDSGVVR